MKTKIQELKEVIGKEVSCNFSPTLRAKLLKVNKKECILEVQPTLYRMTSDLMKDVGKTFKMPVEHTWNAFFY